MKKRTETNAGQAGTVCPCISIPESKQAAKRRFCALYDRAMEEMASISVQIEVLKAKLNELKGVIYNYDE